MQFKTLAFLSILSIIFFTGCGDKEENTNNQTQTGQTKEVKKEVQTSTYKLITTDNKTINVTIEDKKVKIKEYENKVVLLNFFATWCPPCKAEIPNLIKLQDKYGEDFVVISVLLENNKTNEEIKAFEGDFKINYPVTNSQANFAIADKIGPVKTIPTMYMIDKEANIFQKYVGIVPFEMMEIDIKKILKK